jgi:hypothetical protein
VLDRYCQIRHFWLHLRGLTALRPDSERVSAGVPFFWTSYGCTLLRIKPTTPIPLSEHRKGEHKQPSDLTAITVAQELSLGVLRPSDDNTTFRQAS